MGKAVVGLERGRGPQIHQYPTREPAVWSLPQAQGHADAAAVGFGAAAALANLHDVLVLFREHACRDCGGLDTCHAGCVGVSFGSSSQKRWHTMYTGSPTLVKSYCQWHLSMAPKNAREASARHIQQQRTPCQFLRPHYVIASVTSRSHRSPVPILQPRPQHGMRPCLTSLRPPRQHPPLLPPLVFDVSMLHLASKFPQHPQEPAPGVRAVQAASRRYATYALLWKLAAGRATPCLRRPTSQPRRPRAHRGSRAC